MSRHLQITQWRNAGFPFISFSIFHFCLAYLLTSLLSVLLGHLGVAHTLYLTPSGPSDETTLLKNSVGLAVSECIPWSRIAKLIICLPSPASCESLLDAPATKLGPITYVAPSTASSPRPSLDHSTPQFPPRGFNSYYLCMVDSCHHVLITRYRPVSGLRGP